MCDWCIHYWHPSQHVSKCLLIDKYFKKYTTEESHSLKINKHSLFVCEYRPPLGKRFGNCAAVSVIWTWTWTWAWFQLVQRTQRPLGNRWRHTSVTHNVTFGANTQNLCHLQRDVLPRTRTDRNNNYSGANSNLNGRDHQLQLHCADMAAAQQPTTLCWMIFLSENLLTADTVRKQRAVESCVCVATCVFWFYFTNVPQAQNWDWSRDMWQITTHLLLPARRCLTACMRLSSPPAGCSCSCPLPWQCRASAK